jgi:predicted ATPase
VPQRLVQREAELEAIERLLVAARRGSGGALVVEGPPGIGKTSLLRAAAGRARELGLRVHTARADDFERRFPFAVVHQLFEPALRALPSGEAVDLIGGGVPRRAAVVGVYALAARLAEQRPLAVALDDADRSDEASLEWLRFVLPRLGGLRLAVGARRTPA